MQQVIMDGSSSSSSSAAPTWWSLNNTMPVPFPQPSSNPEMWHPDHGSQDLPESWCQLLLGGLVAEEEKHGFKRMGINDNCGVLDQLLREQQMVHPSPSEAQIAAGFHHQVSSSWNQNPIVSASSPRSCVTSSNMLDFSHKPRQQIDNNSSEGNSTETAPALKKAKVLGCSSPKSTLKVRKEKLGDRITTLHQLVSPFGKALSSPYLEQPQAMRQQKQQKTVNDNGDGDEQSRKDLRSRGLCLVPVSFTMHVGSDNGADLWAAALGGGF
ncbi:hypothetical protein ZIOFF_046644 [Zingiber officinale]|uniref:Transcription factor bHLH68-like n=1 Tax=Zingiber officinale TaxID=94328 RepID=A0A8J5FN78_ZINOF|nr:hypothetical protein ZIOFF_046644 [Zingiber officinale]